MAFSTPRHATSATGDQTYKATGMSLSYTAVDYATTIAITPDARESVYLIGAATGNPTINVTTTTSYVGDVIKLIGVSSGGTRTVTPGTNTIHTGALSVADTKKFSWVGVFDGTDFVEQSQAIGA